MRYDYTKTPNANMAALINKTAVFPNYKPEMFVLGAVTVLTPAAGNNFSNTQISLNPLDGIGYPTAPAATVQYNRIPLYAGKPALKYLKVKDLTNHNQVLPNLSSTYKVDTTGFMVTNPTFLPKNGQLANYKVTIPVSSSVYIPETKDVLVKNESTTSYPIPASVKFYFSPPFNGLDQRFAWEQISREKAVSSTDITYPIIESTNNQIVSFNGTTSGVEFDYSKVPNLLDGDFTIEGWFYFHARNSDGAKVLLAQWSSTDINKKGFALVLDDLNLKFYFGPFSKTAPIVESHYENGFTGAPNFSEFNHVAVMKKDGIFTIYLNGREPYTLFGTPYPNAKTHHTFTGTDPVGIEQNWTIGRSVGNGFINSLMQVRELAIWNTARYGYTGAQMTFTPNVNLI